MARAEFETYKCIKRCGWFRTWNVNQEKADEIISHPLHGNIRNIDSARRDIAAHECGSYLAALGRLRGGSNSDGTQESDSVPERDNGTAA